MLDAVADEEAVEFPFEFLPLISEDLSTDAVRGENVVEEPEGSLGAGLVAKGDQNDESAEVLYTDHDAGESPRRLRKFAEVDTPSVTQPLRL